MSEIARLCLFLTPWRSSKAGGTSLDRQWNLILRRSLFTLGGRATVKSRSRCLFCTVICSIPSFATRDVHDNTATNVVSAAASSRKKSESFALHCGSAISCFSRSSSSSTLLSLSTGSCLLTPGLIFPALSLMTLWRSISLCPDRPTKSTLADFPRTLVKRIYKLALEK
jgi:hypothetical protein